MVISVSCDDTLRKTRKMVLESAGFEVRDCTSKRELAAAVRAAAPGSVILLCHSAVEPFRSAAIRAGRVAGFRVIELPKLKGVIEPLELIEFVSAAQGIAAHKAAASSRSAT